jgi:hypothetical protein
MRHNRYSQSRLITQPDPWFRQRQRVFMYHYLYQPQFGPPVQWQDLAGTHCQYRGWLHLSNWHRGEIWTYPTQKHFMLVQMLVTKDSMITRADWQRIKKEDQQKDQQWQQQIRALTKKNRETYTWWGEER